MRHPDAPLYRTPRDWDQGPEHHDEERSALHALVALVAWFVVLAAGATGFALWVDRLRALAR